MRTKRLLAVGAIALGLVAMVLGLTMRLSARDARAAATDPGTATFSMSGDGAHALSSTFTVTTNLSAVSFGPATLNWGGYEEDLTYDSAVLQVNTIAPVTCPAGTWGNPEPPPAGSISMACAFQANTSTSAALETISFTCLANGVSAIHFLDISALFDGNGVPFTMTLVDGSVTCGAGGPTNTPTLTPTNTPVTPTNTPTSTFTPTSTSTPTVTNTPCDPQLGCPTNTPTNTPGTGIYSTATPTGTRSPEAGTETATSVPGQPTNTTAPGGTGNLPGGGAGAGSGAPRITLPDTGAHASGSNDAMGGIWLIVSGVVLATLGGGIFVTARKRA